MVFNTLASFELTEKIAHEMLEGKEIPMPHGEFPFNEFCIIFPMTALSFNEISSKLTTLMKSVVGDAKMTIHVLYEQDGMIVTFYDHKDMLIKAKLTEGHVDVLEALYRNKDFTNIYLEPALILIQGVVSNYLSPTTIIKKDEVRENRSKSVLKEYKSPSKKYIYKTRYVFAGKREVQEEPRPFTRHTDAWLVNGHIRRYRDADGNILKEVYIKPYKKGTGALKTQEYKITRL